MTITGGKDGDEIKSRAFDFLHTHENNPVSRMLRPSMQRKGIAFTVPIPPGGIQCHGCTLLHPYTHTRIASLAPEIKQSVCEQI